jgi:UDP-3-O-[3-hydroxymyristoyl] N-acetylglucosamine deacetylase
VSLFILVPFIYNEWKVISINPRHETAYRSQRTIKKAIDYSGIGLHTGAQVTMHFIPAKEGSGVCFKRVDLPGQPIIPATVEYVCENTRNTTLGIADVRIHTVEHVLAAIRAFNIDNIMIELNGIEPPVGNGSSDVFVSMIEESGIQEQEGVVPIVKLSHPVYWSEGEIHIVAIPSDHYCISYTLNYPETKLIKSQYYSFALTSDRFKQEIAPCRTFSLYEEVSLLLDRGLIKGASLDNAVVIKDDTILSKGGLYFPDEMVRHKILDMIGDLSLIGFDIQAHIIAIRSGHASNVAFARKLFNSITMEHK